MTKENAHLYLPFVQALVEGKTVQIIDRYGDWRDTVRPAFCEPPESYRIKPERQPLDASDVPPGSVFRHRDDSVTSYWAAPTTVIRSGVTLMDEGNVLKDVTWRELMDICEIKRPNEDWKPCAK